MPLAVTALYTGLLGLLFLGLSALVVANRYRSGVALGEGGDKVLERAIRVHANFAEYVPLTLILIAALEMNGVPAWTVHALGLALLAGRLLHAWGLYRSSGTSFGRGAGVFLTWTVLLLAALGAIWQAAAV